MATDEDLRTLAELYAAGELSLSEFDTARRLIEGGDSAAARAEAAGRSLPTDPAPSAPTPHTAGNSLPSTDGTSESEARAWHSPTSQEYSGGDLAVPPSEANPRRSSTPLWAGGLAAIAIAALAVGFAGNFAAFTSPEEPPTSKSDADSAAAPQPPTPTEAPPTPRESGNSSPRSYSVTTPKAMVEAAEERQSRQLDEVPTEEAQTQREPHAEHEGADVPDADSTAEEESNLDPERDDPGAEEDLGTDVPAELRFEGHIEPGESAQRLVEFLLTHPEEVVYLNVTTPDPGDEHFYRNDFLRIQDSQPAGIGCRSCHVEYHFFGLSEVPARAVRVGANVQVKGDFVVAEAWRGNSRIILSGPPQD